jgi:multiple sugar transport system substrate-binding protein
MRRIAMAVVATLLALALSSSAFGQALKGTVSFMGWGDEPERLMYETVFKDFEAQNPGVKVNYIFTPDDYYTKLQTMIAGGTPPDLFYLAEGRIAQFAKDGACLDLDPYIKKYPALTADFVDGLLRYGNYKGKQYAIPKDWQPILMYVNEDIFKASGVAIPTSAWTMDDYLAIAKKLTKVDAKGKTLQWGAAVENYRADWMVFARNYGGEWFKDGKSNWSDPKVIKGMEVMCKVIADKSAPSPEALSGMGQSQTQLFETGKVGMFPTGRWAVPTYRDSCAGFKWSAVEMPKGSMRSNPIITAALTASAKTKNPELAIALLRHILSEKSLATVMKLGIGMPAYKKLLAKSEFVSAPPAVEPFIATGAYIDQKVQYEAVMTGSYAKFQDVIAAQLDLAMAGTISMKEAAAAIDKKANAEIFK